MRINQNNGPVQAEQPPQINHAHKGGQADTVRAGHLAGQNLQISHDGQGNAVQANPQGVGKPALIPPRAEVSVNDYKAVLQDLDNLVAGSYEQVVSDVKQAGIPFNKLPQVVSLGDLDVAMTANGLLGGDQDNAMVADFAKGTMRMNIGGDDVQMSFSKAGGLDAALNGEPLNLNDDEVATMSDFFMLMSLFHEMGVEQRKMGRESRNLANETVVNKIKNQAEEQRNAAGAKLVAGMVGGAIKVASATITMAGGVKGLKADQQAANMGSSARPGQMIAQTYQAVGQMVDGLGETASSAVQYKAALHEAQVTELRSQEEQARHVKQTEQDFMQTSHELASKARETFSQVWSAYLQAQQATTRNI